MEEPVEFDCIDLWPTAEEAPPVTLLGPDELAAEYLVFREEANASRDRNLR